MSDIWTSILITIFSQVDPIVASFAGGAVGVISALMLIEVNNVEQQEKKRCKYCHGSGTCQLSLETQNLFLSLLCIAPHAVCFALMLLSWFETIDLEKIVRFVTML